jgi:hypothetical protein
MEAASLPPKTAGIGRATLAIIAVPVPEPRRSAPSLPKAIVPAVLGALVVVPFLLRLAVLERRGFGPDEFEHLHFAWSVAHGQVPYRDYFDHHTPALHFLLAPLFSLYRVETSSADAVAAIFAARRLTWAFAAASLGLTFALARSWRGAREAGAATLLLSGTWIFLTKTLEIRPDVPATASMVAGLWAALGGWRRLAAARAGAGGLFAGSGALFAATFLFTQKVAFLLPGVAAAELLMLASPHLAAARSARVRAVMAQAVGFLLPIALALAWFWREDALRAFLHCNFTLNARWPGLGPREFVRRFLGDDPAFVALAAIGLAREGRTLLRAEGVARGEPLIALALATPVAALLVHPAVTFHYFLLFLPQAALYAGAALVWVADRLGGAFARERGAGGPARAAWALATLAVLVSLHPLGRFARLFGDSNWNALEGIRYVIRNSAPWETAFDGFSGLGVFRPSAFYHPFQHWHTRAIQTEAQQRHVVDALTSGAAMPKLVFWDEYLREGAPAGTGPFVEEHYARIGPPPIRGRLFDNDAGWWTDEGPRYLGWVPGRERAPHVFCDDGWRDPGVLEGIACRRTRTRSAELVVPVRDPADFEVIVRARATAGLPFDIELRVNGTDAGRQAASPRWQEYAFPARGPDLSRGFNLFRLRLRPPDGADAPRPELAVETIALRRASALTPASGGP